MLNFTVNILVLYEIRCSIYLAYSNTYVYLHKILEQISQHKGYLSLAIINITFILKKLLMIPSTHYLILEEFIIHVPFNFFIYLILPIILLKSQGFKLNGKLGMDYNIYLVNSLYILSITLWVLYYIDFYLKGLCLTFIYLAISCILARIYSLNRLLPEGFSIYICPVVFLELCLLFNDADTFKFFKQGIMYLQIPYEADYWYSNIGMLYLILVVSGLVASRLAYLYLPFDKIKYLGLRGIILLLLILLDIYVLTHCGFTVKSKFIEFRPDIWVTILYINSNMAYLIINLFINDKKIFSKFLWLNNLKPGLKLFNVKPGIGMIILGLIYYILLFANYYAFLGFFVVVLAKGLGVILENVIAFIDKDITIKNGLVFINLYGSGNSGNNGSNDPGGNHGGGPSSDNIVIVDPNSKKGRKVLDDKAFNHRWERLGRRLFADLSRTERRVEARNRALARRAANPGSFRLSPLTSVTPLPSVSNPDPFNFSPLISPATLPSASYPGPSSLSPLTSVTPATLLNTGGSNWHSLDASVQKVQTHLRIRSNDCFEDLEFTKGNSLEKGVAIDHIINLVLKHKEVGGRRIKSSLFSTCPHIGKFICKHLLDTQPEYARIHLMDKALDGEIRPVLGRLETPHEKFLQYFKK